VKRARALSDALAAAELHPVILSGPAAFRPAPEGEDVTFIDGADALAAFAFAERLRAEQLPCLALIGLRDNPPSEESGPLDAWLNIDAVGASISRRVRSFYRDGIACAEAASRVRTAATLQIRAPETDVMSRSGHLLYVGAPTPQFLSFDAALKASGIYVQATLTPFSAFDQLDFTDFDALILNAEPDASGALSMLGAARRNSRLQNVLAYVLTAKSDMAEEALARGADDVIGAKAPPKSAAAWIAEDIRRVRRRRAASLVLADTLDGETHTPSFFCAHVDAQVQASHDDGRPLAIALIEVAGGEHLDAETWRKGFAEFVTLCWHTVRDYDLKAVMDTRTLALSFPGTDLAGAQAAADRLVAICKCTAFAAGDKSGAPLAFFTRVAELSPGESGPGLLARLIMRTAA
jgi:PleD family two-component response regulator